MTKGNSNSSGIIALVAIVIALLVAGFALYAVKMVAPQPLGSVASPDIPSPWLKYGGLTTYRARAALNTATTTPCAIQSPAATSTLLSSELVVTTATSTQTIWTAATSTTAFATSSNIVPNITLASGKQGTMTVSTSSNNGIDGPTVLPPNSWVVWGVAGVRPADTTLLNGYCQAEFRSTGN